MGERDATEVSVEPAWVRDGPPLGPTFVVGIDDRTSQLCMEGFEKARAQHEAFVREVLDEIERRPFRKVKINYGYERRLVHFREL